MKENRAQKSHDTPPLRNVSLKLVPVKGTVARDFLRPFFALMNRSVSKIKSLLVFNFFKGGWSQDF
jgi:hypothetical protein